MKKINLVQSLLKYISQLSNSNGYSEFLTYSWMLKNGVIIHKDGSLSIHYEYYAPDLDSQVEYSVNILAVKLFQAFSHLDGGWMIETNLISAQQKTYYKTDNQVDLVSTFIDKEREEFFLNSNDVFSTKTILSFTFKSEKKTLESFKSVLYSMEDVEEKADKEVIGCDFEMVKKFQKDVNIVTDLLRSNSIFTRRLEESETYQFLKDCVNCTDTPAQVFDYKCFINKLFLDTALSQSDVRTGSELKIGDKYVKCISLDDIPNEYYPSILNELNTLCLDFRYSIRFNYLSKAGIINIFKSAITGWSFKLFGGVKGFVSSMMNNSNSPVKRDSLAEDMLTDIEMAKTREKFGYKFGYMNLVIIVSHEDKEELQEKVTYLMNVVRAEAFTPRIETANATNSFLGSLPSHGGYNIRKSPAELELFVNLMPSMGIYQGSPYSTFNKFPKHSAPLIECMTARGNRKFYFNLHRQDVGHTIIVGPSGTGKSVLMSEIAAQWIKKYPKVRIIGSDSHNSMLGTVTALQGKYIDIERDLVKLSPFLHCNDDVYVKSFLNSWLLNIYKLNNEGKTAGKKERKSIVDAIERVGQYDKEHRTIERFIAQLDDEHVQGVFTEFNRALPNKILSGNDEDIFEHRIVMFDKKPISQLDISFREPLLELLYYKQIASFKDNHVPFLMIIDEASFEFASAYMRAKMFEYIKMLRHISGAIIFAIQSSIDLVGDGSEETITKIRDNIATQIFLPNEKAMLDHNIRASYEKVGCNEREIEIIANAVRKREYFIKQDHGSQLINLTVGENTLAFTGKTQENKEDLNAMIVMSKEDNFAERWLEREGKI